MDRSTRVHPIGGPYGAARTRLAVVVWLGVAGLWVWFLLRMWRGANNTETGDFNDFFQAAEAMRDGLDIYASGRGGYLYPPLVAWLLEPLVVLGRVGAGAAWGCVNLLLTLCCLTLSVRLVVRAFGGPSDSLTVGVVWLLAMGLTFGPLRAEFEHGQTDAIVLLGLCLGLTFIERLPWVSGLALGLALLVKHHVIVLLAYLVVRRRWKVLTGMLLGGVLFAFLPAVQLGIGKTGAYLGQSYGYLFRLFGGEDAPVGINLHPITWDLSISITSVMARALDGPSGPSMALVGLATLPFAGAVFFATWWVYRRHGVAMFVARGGGLDAALPAVVLLEWCGVIVGILAFSPQSITRHAFIMLPAHVLVAYVLLVKRPGACKWPLLVGVIGYQLAARLPPGAEPFEAALNAWRHVGGATWFLLAMWLGLVWSTLSFANAAPSSALASAVIDDEPKNRPDAPDPA